MTTIVFWRFSRILIQRWSKYQTLQSLKSPSTWLAPLCIIVRNQERLLWPSQMFLLRKPKWTWTPSIFRVPESFMWLQGLCCSANILCYVDTASTVSTILRDLHKIIGLTIRNQFWKIENEMSTKLKKELAVNKSSIWTHLPLQDDTLKCWLLSLPCPKLSRHDNGDT